MSEQSQGADDVLARLTEIERRLGEIQSELLSGDPADQARAELTVSAGPFTSTSDVQAFERALGEIPAVTAVSVRGYEGSDHAIFEVRLS
jgi:hypothetical protein